MKKKLLVLLVLLLAVTGCVSGKYNKEEAAEFKNTYESFNGKEIGEHKYRSVTIDKNNPFVKATDEEILKKIEAGDTFYVYFGDSKCPWCRSVIEEAIKVAKEEKVYTIYYVDIWDKDFNEIVRDKYELDKKGKVKKVKDGSEAYAKLLKKFDSLLSDYTLTDKEGNEVKVGEKRIYAPNYFFIQNGKAVKMTEGISKKQTDAFGKLTNEILKDENKLFEDFFKED